MSDDHEKQVSTGAQPASEVASVSWLETQRPDPGVAPTRPSLLALLLSGVVAGAALGAANGVLFHYIVGMFESPQGAGLWGAGLGIAGGVVVVLFRRIWWGPEISVEVGTILGLLYGIVPGLAVLFQVVIVNRIVGKWSLVAMVMAGSMAGLLIGGMLDRLTETIIGWKKRS